MKNILLLVLLGLVSLTSVANSLPKVTAVTEDLWPFNYVENHVIKGSHTLFIKHLLESINADYKLAVYPWARSYKLALSRPNTLIYTINRTPHRERKFHWIGRFPVNADIYLYGLHNTRYKGWSLEQLKTLRIGTQIGTANEQFLIDNGFKHISHVSHVSQSVGMLMRDRVDLVIGSPQQLSYATKQQHQHIKSLTPIAYAFSSTPSIALSLSSSPELVKALRDAYQQIVTKQDVCQIMQLPAPRCSQSSHIFSKLNNKREKTN